MSNCALMIQDRAQANMLFLKKTSVITQILRMMLTKARKEILDLQPGWSFMNIRMLIIKKRLLAMEIQNTSKLLLKKIKMMQTVEAKVTPIR